MFNFITADMSFPRRTKRYEYKSKFQENRDGHYVAGLANSSHSIALANIVTQFEHLEKSMELIFCYLLRIEESTMSPAGYVFRSIRSPTQKIKALKKLLQECPDNKNVGETMDAIIDEYDKISIQRNRYVHGLWWTHDDGRVFLEAKLKDGSAFLNAEQIDHEDMQIDLRRITELNFRILTRQWI